jgi:hypothetical protein
MLLAEMTMKSGRRQGEERGRGVDVPHGRLVLDLTADGQVDTPCSKERDGIE